MDLILARRHPVAVHNRFPIAPQEPLAGGAHGVPYVQTIGYACSRVGCAVRTRVFRRPGCGAPPRRLPEGRGRDGCDREGQGPGEGWPHPAHGPIFATIHPGAMHNLSPHLPELAPRTVGTRPTGRCAGKKRSRARRTGHVDRPCATRHDATHQHDHFLGAIDARNKRKAPRAESMRGNYGTGAIHLG